VVLDFESVHEIPNGYSGSRGFRSKRKLSPEAAAAGRLLSVTSLLDSRSLLLLKDGKGNHSIMK